MIGEIAVGIAGGLLLVLAFIGVGGGLLCSRSPESEPTGCLRRAPVAAALGFSVYSYASYPVVAVRSPPAGLIVALTLIGIVIGGRYWSATLRELLVWLREHSRAWKSPLVLGFGAMSVGLLILVGINWLTPPKEGDALQGYMFTARWLHRHAFAYSPYNPRYSLMPIATEIVYSLSFAFGTDLAAKVMDGLLGVLFLFGIYEFTRRYASPLFSFFAAASMAAMTSFVTNWANGKVDVTCGFVLFSAFSLLFWEPERLSTRNLGLSSFLVGTACAQKYSTWILVPAFLLAVVVISRARRERCLRTKLLGSCLVILLCLIPHFTRDIVLTNDPVAPFAKSVFPTKNVYLGHTSDAIPTRAFDIPKLPYLLFFAGDDSRKPGPLPLLILVGIPAFLWAARKEREPKWILSVALFQLAVWVAVRGSDWLVPRFLLAPVALLLVVSAVGLEHLSRRCDVGRWLTTAMVAGVLFTLGLWDNRHFRESWRFVLGRESRAEWQARMVPHRGYPALHAIAPRMDKDHRLMIGASIYNLPEETLPYASTERELYDFGFLSEEGRRDYLIQNHFAFVYYRGTGVPKWAEEARVVARANDWFVLYELQNGPS